ncbi:MAG: hypothetical protein KDB69_08610 [Acidimicrobiia bacterium]|nr:hypothetical protein [Acidimicrobiia bacterium]
MLVAVATGPIEAGSRIGTDDIRFVPIDADFVGLPGLLDEASWATMAGWVANQSIPEGGVIATSALAPAVDGQGLRTMSVPIATEHAAGGLIEVGDVVDVISVVDSAPEYVVTGVAVVRVAAETGGIGSNSDYYIVLAVDAEEALRLAGSIDGGSIEIVRSTGAEPVGEMGAAGGGP